MRLAAMAILVATATLTPQLHAAKTCDVHHFGARGDGVAKDTAAIQKAIDGCKGGTVKVGPGTYLTGPIEIKSNVTFDLESGATLLGSPDRADFGPYTFAGKQTVAPLVRTSHAENVVITGGGVIDGNGHLWWEYVKGVPGASILGTDHPRPMGLLIDHSKHVRVDHVTVQNSGFWQIVPYYSDDVHFSYDRVLAPKSPNTDGLDPFSSSNITIDHLYEAEGDDNIAIKSGAIDSPGPDAPSHDITITDCTFAAGHGISIGSELSGGAYNIHIERVHLSGTDQGIRIKANRDRGHDVSNITFKDVDMVDVHTAILISEYYPKVYPEGDVAAAPIGRLTPFFHNIRIENVKATGSASAGVIVGLPESRVKDIVLTNVDIQAKTGMKIAYADVVLNDVKITAQEGEAITVSPTAKVTGK